MKEKIKYKIILSILVEALIISLIGAKILVELDIFKEDLIFVLSSILLNAFLLTRFHIARKIPSKKNRKLTGLQTNLTTNKKAGPNSRNLGSASHSTLLIASLILLTTSVAAEWPYALHDAQWTSTSESSIPLTTDNLFIFELPNEGEYMSIPVAGGGYAYFAYEDNTTNDKLVKFDLNTKKIVWEKPLPFNDAIHLHRYGIYLNTEYDRLIVMISRLYAYDLDGNNVWNQTDDYGFSYRAIPLIGDDDKIYVGSYQSFDSGASCVSLVYEYEIFNGTKTFSVKKNSGLEGWISCSSNPLKINALSKSGDYLHALSSNMITTYYLPTGEETNRSGPGGSLGIPVSSDGNYFFSIREDNLADEIYKHYSVDSQIVDSITLSYPESLNSKPIASNGNLYFHGRDNTFFIYGEDLNQVWNYTITSRSYSSTRHGFQFNPIIGSNVFLFPAILWDNDGKHYEGGLYAFDKNSREKLWHLSVKNIRQPIIDEGRLIIPTGGNQLYILEDSLKTTCIDDSDCMQGQVCGVQGLCENKTVYNDNWNQPQHDVQQNSFTPSKIPVEGDFLLNISLLEDGEGYYSTEYVSDPVVFDGKIYLLTRYNYQLFNETSGRWYNDRRNYLNRFNQETLKLETRRLLTEFGIYGNDLQGLLANPEKGKLILRSPYKIFIYDTDFNQELEIDTKWSYPNNIQEHAWMIDGELVYVSPKCTNQVYGYDVESGERKIQLVGNDVMCLSSHENKVTSITKNGYHICTRTQGYFIDEVTCFDTRTQFKQLEYKIEGGPGGINLGDKGYLYYLGNQKHRINLFTETLENHTIDYPLLDSPGIWENKIYSPQESGITIYDKETFENQTFIPNTISGKKTPTIGLNGFIQPVNGQIMAYNHEGQNLWNHTTTDTQTQPIIYKNTIITMDKNTKQLQKIIDKKTLPNLKITKMNTRMN